jgi:hypothetical protein
VVVVVVIVVVVALVMLVMVVCDGGRTDRQRIVVPSHPSPRLHRMPPSVTPACRMGVRHLLCLLAPPSPAQMCAERYNWRKGCDMRILRECVDVGRTSHVCRPKHGGQRDVLHHPARALIDAHPLLKHLLLRWCHEMCDVMDKGM